MQSNFFLQTEDDGRKLSPYDCALLVDEHNEGYYSIVIPTESIASVSGEPEVFDYNILTEIAKGQVKGKEEMEAGSVNFYYNRENCNRLDQLKGKVLPYATFLNNGLGVKYTAELSYRINDIDNSSLVTGTMTITPSGLGEQDFDMRDKVKKTLQFGGTIPLKLPLADKNPYTINCPLAIGDPENVTVTISVIGIGADKYQTSDWTDGKFTVTAQEGITQDDYAMIVINLKDDKSKMAKTPSVNRYAPWEYYINLSYVGEAGE